MKRYYSRRVFVQPYIILFIAALLMSIIFVSSKAYADNTEPHGPKMYKSVIIYSGDTLQSIAKDYYSDDFVSFGRYISEIASINNLSKDSKLTPGNHIIVPYYEHDNSIYFIVSTE